MAVAALGLGALAQLPDRRDTRKVLVGDRGGVDVPRHDLAVVDDVARVHGAGEHLLDVFSPPGAAVALAGEVGATRRIDPFAGELLGEPFSAVTAVKVLSEHALHSLEVGHRVVRHHEPAGFKGVAERGVSILPVPTLCLAPHPADHVARQLL